MLKKDSFKFHSLNERIDYIFYMACMNSLLPEFSDEQREHEVLSMILEDREDEKEDT